MQVVFGFHETNHSQVRSARNPLGQPWIIEKDPKQVSRDKGAWNTQTFLEKESMKIKIYNWTSTLKKMKLKLHVMLPNVQSTILGMIGATSTKPNPFQGLQWICPDINITKTGGLLLFLDPLSRQCLLHSPKEVWTSLKWGLWFSQAEKNSQPPKTNMAHENYRPAEKETFLLKNPSFYRLSS